MAKKEPAFHLTLSIAAASLSPTHLLHWTKLPYLQG